MVMANNGASEPDANTVHGLVARRAAAAPDHLALVWDDGSMTYGALVAEATRVANSLRCRGVSPGSLVGLCGRTGPRLVIGLLAILQSGAGYVPLNPDDPSAYRDYVIADSGCKIVLADRADAELLADSGVEVLGFDGDAGADSTSPAGASTGDDLAYVIYTSGSTGRPKGVQVEHRSILNLIAGGFAATGPGQTYCAVAPPTFDSTTFEVWGCLGNGGTLVLPPPGLLDPYRIADIFEKYGLTVLVLTKGLFNVVVDTAVDRLQGLGQLLTGGDVLSPPHVRKALRALPGTVLSNCYGPTEATTFTTVHERITRAETEGRIPIGRPIPGAYVHVLDAELRPVPDGVEGELFIGGAGLARGYMDPALTRERFLPDPLAPGTSARVYRTGDNVLRRADGVLEFIGRYDNQVKIRGFRVELDAVEIGVLSVPGVREACCVTHTDPTGEKWLTAYVVLEPGLSVAALREATRHILPSYMNPAWYVELPSLPLKSNGKVDRAGLPKPKPTLR